MLAYLKSFYTKLAFIMGLVMYVSYAIPTDSWSNTYLIFVGAFVAVFLPYYTKISEWFEQKGVLYTGSMFFGKIIRFIWQFVFNYFAIYMLVQGGIVKLIDLEMIGGIWGAVTFTSFSSQGLQYLMLGLANRNIGNRYLNITLALSMNVVLSAIASLGVVWVQIIFLIMGIILGFVGAFYSLLTDLKGLFAPKGGIGIFFGTFNPAHVSHMAIIKKFIKDRNLERVYVHPTVVPKIHQALLDEGIIKIANVQDGMRIYEKTEKADYHINYFPTGNIFFEVENRLAMLNAAVNDSNLDHKVEILYLPDIYDTKGFYGIIDYIRKLHKGKRIHGLHGSDYGGMLIRNIYDESLCVWPFTIVRKDNISATAIRNGKKGMTTPTVTEILNVLKDTYKKTEGSTFRLGNSNYTYMNSRLFLADYKKRESN